MPHVSMLWFATQTPPGLGAVADSALNQLIQTGILGIITVLLIVAVIILFRKIEDLHATRVKDDKENKKEIVQLYTEQSKLLAENNLVAKQQVGLMDRVLDRAAGKDRG